MKLDIQALSQRDSRWASKKLGTSSVTIGGYGCVLTCLTMLCNYYKHPLTPDQLNEMLINVNGFSNGNLMKWEVLTQLFSDIKWEGRVDCPDVPAPLNTIDEYLDKRMPVVVCVDFDPKEGLQQHFVLVIGKDNNDYFVNDPWTGETYYFSAKYGKPSEGVYGLRLYSGNLDPVVPMEDLVLQKKIDELAQKVAELNTLTSTIKDKQDSLWTSVDNVKKDTEELYKDRDVITVIKENTTSIEGKVKESIAKQTAIETGLRIEIRKLKDETGEEIDTLAKRVKTLEEKPIPIDGVAIKFKIGSWILGKLAKEVK
jgi:hypothetical protein